MHLAKCNKAIA